MAVSSASSVFALNVRFSVANNTPVEDFVRRAADSLGKKDLKAPLDTLRQNWVNSVADLRLLVQEGELRGIGLPMRLVVWIEDELSRHAEDAAGGAGQMARDELQFNYTFDFDNNGVLYHVATAGGTEEWRNPADAGRVVVASSGLLGDSVPLAAIVGRQAVRCVTAAHQSSWMSVDLVDKWLLPTHYTVRHYSSWDTEALRSWVLEASNDGLKWTRLRVHDDDQSLSKQGQAYTWDIQRSPGMKHGFRIFRLRMTKPNSNNHMYLACSGLEFYGTLTTRAPPADDEKASARPLPRVAEGQTREFRFERPLDGKGLVSFLATAGGTRPFANPADAGLVAVTASSLMHDSVPLSAVVGNEVVRCVTRAEPHSWIRVDLLTRRIMPTHYMLRHYSSWDVEALRSWRFEGSNDGLNWELLREHEDDKSLDKKGKAAAWPVPAEHHDTAYQMFRVLQTASNSNNHHYLALSGFDVYGKMVEGRAAGGAAAGGAARSAPARAAAGGAASRDGRVFSYQSDFDGNGIIDYIGTAEDTASWTNPALAGRVRVTASSLMPDSTEAHMVVGHEVVRCVTKPQPKSWFAIDLVTYSVRPTHYTLRHYSSWDVEALRNWDFEGSNDGVNWTRLRRHDNDVGLHTRGGTFTWPLVGVTDAFRIFRILQWGVNSNRHNYLSLSGFELYGELTKLSPAAAEAAGRVDPSTLTWDGTPAMLSKNLEVRDDGKLVVNTGSNDKWQLVRSKQAFSLGTARFAVLVETDRDTTNTWRMIIGAVPVSFPPPPSAGTKGKEWVGANGSWGYIAGSGGKCSGTAKSFPYGETYHQGDVVSVEVNFDRKTIEFYKNGQSQSVAYQNVSGPLQLAVSFTGTGTALRIVDEAAALERPLAAVGPAWDTAQRSRFVQVSGAEAMNKGSSDKWQSVRSVSSFSGGQHSFTVKIVDSPATPNNWKFIVGVVPPTFPMTWVGAAESWGYIGGTGGKCYNVGSSMDYGAPFGKAGDAITVRLDFARGTIEYLLNGKSQGIAFSNLSGPVYAAVSMTATGAKVLLADVE